MANIFRGKAQISGVNGVVTVSAVAWELLKESAQISNEFDLEEIKNENGRDFAWKASNEKDNATIGFRLVDTGSASSEARIENFCNALTPLVGITLSSFKPARFNGSYQLMSGGDYNLSNVQAGTGSLKMRKYVDADQQTLSTTVFTPTYSTT